MAKFVVVAEGDIVDAEFTTRDYEVATEMFKKLANDPEYYDVNLYDGETGEVYAYRTTRKDACGTAVTFWVASN